MHALLTLLLLSCMPACLPLPCILRWAYDYIQNMVSPIDNYVHKGTHTFLHGSAPNGVR